jgi:hypothetical protein
MNVPALILVAAGMVASPALFAGTVADPAESGTVFRCATKDGRTTFSDQPCVGAERVQLWKPAAVASGIERSSAGAAAAPQPTRAADTQRYDPFVECTRRGGRFDLAARICKLPEDAARQMFRAQ